MSRILLAPSAPLSLHDTPRTGEVVLGTRPVVPVVALDDVPALMPSLPHGAMRRLREHATGRIAVVRVPPAEDEREQQAIADAVEGVIP